MVKPAKAFVSWSGGKDCALAAYKAMSNGFKVACLLNIAEYEHEKGTTVPEGIQFARLLQEAGADAVTVINTVQAMAIDAHSRRPVISSVFAGLSGPLSLSIRINAGTLPPGHWILDPAEGGGRLLGEGCHFIDWAGAIVGSAPSVVDCRPIGRKAGEQDWSLRLSYPDGSVADILYVSDGADGAGKERFEVHGGGRSAVLEDFRILRLHAFGTKTLRAWLRSDKGHAAQWRAFCGAVEKGGPSPVPWKEILGTMRAVFSARRSLQSGRAEVLPVDP